MIHYRLIASSCVVFALLHPAGASTNFTQCLADIRSGLYNETMVGTVGSLDNSGNRVPYQSTTAISYDLCKLACGTGPEPFTWTIFSAQFSAWLIPWLALVSQLPFGSQMRADDFMSVLLTVGSPALAAYSLVLTVLNGQWVSRRLAGIQWPNVTRVWRVLSTLQQSALHIDDSEGMLASLIVLPENDEWWEELAHGLDYTQTWSASAFSQIAWVVIAYIFTVIDSFADLTNSINSNGQGVGSAFLWLLPIVIGWLQLSPKSDSKRVRIALERANAKSFHATASPTVSVLASEVTGRRAFSLTSYADCAARRDEEASAPIYNYARFLPWVANVEHVAAVLDAAAQRGKAHQPVNQYYDWKAGEKDKPIMDENRRGTLEQVKRYVYAARFARVGRIDSDFLMRFLVAVALALFLQWGSIGGAIVAVWFTPTIGLGCRSGSYLLYAVNGTLIWAIMVTSSFLSYYSSIATQSASPCKSPSSPYRYASITGALATFLRRLGKLLAVCNSIWIVLSCVFQFSSFYDRCYCNSSVLGLGKNAYNVISLLDSDINVMKSSWIGAVVLALGTAAIFEGFICLHVNPPPPAS